MGLVRSLLLVLALLTGLAGAAISPPAAAADSTVASCSGGRIPDPDDDDCDGAKDWDDNCPAVRNADQLNTDSGYTTTNPAAQDGSTDPMPGGDGAGDPCDDDDDADGIPDMRDSDGNGSLDAVQDNCPLVRNPEQYGDPGTRYGGTTADGTRLCPPTDGDGDGVYDDVDNCRFHVNGGQEDLDADRRGDICDTDDDGDTVSDGIDNCPRTSNSAQEDSDGDGIGAACDPGEAASVPPQELTNSSLNAGAAAGDTVAPRVVVRIPRVQRAWDLLGGMPASVRCSEACGLTARVTLASRDARRLRLPRRLGTGTALLGAAGRTWLFVTTPRRAARRVPRRGVRAMLTVVATDEAGNRRTARRRITLRR